MPNVAKKACPGFFTCEGLIADLFCDVGISPHRGHVTEVVEAVCAQSEAFGFDDRNLHADILSFFGIHLLYATAMTPIAKLLYLLLSYTTYLVEPLGMSNSSEILLGITAFHPLA